MEDDEAGYVLEAIHGGRLTDRPVLFSKDSRFFFVCSGAVVKVYAVETGELVRVLHGHRAEVTAVVHNPANPLQLLSASLDGTVRRWDYEDSVLLQTIDAKGPVLHMAVAETQGYGGYTDTAPTTTTTTTTTVSVAGGTGTTNNTNAAANTGASGVVYVATLLQSKNPDSSKCCRVSAVSLKAGRKAVDLFRMRMCVALSVCGNNVVAAGGWSLYVHSLRSTATVVYNHGAPFTCMDTHASDGVVASGDERGMITVWHDVLTDAVVENPRKTTLHWHAHAVLCVRFAGGLLLSGGEEGVLVQWQLMSGARDFLPRLGAPIQGVSTDTRGELYGLTCADNGVRVVTSASLAKTVSVQGVKPVDLTHVNQFSRQAVEGDAPPTAILRPRLCLEPKHGSVAIAGQEWGVQLYDVTQDRHVYELNVVPHNTISRINNETPNKAHVHHVDFSHDGQWMATVDAWTTPGGVTEQHLKLWSYEASSQQWELNTHVDSPHKENITAIAFHPSEHVLVTCGLDKKFKIWHTIPFEREATLSATSRSVSTTVWACRSVGFYRDVACTACSFSSDGSLLAVACGQNVTLWDPTTNALMNVLLHPPPVETITELAFVPDSPYIVVVTRRRLYVWNVLSCKVLWSFVVRCGSLATAPGLFAVSVENKMAVLIFDVEHSTPVSVVRTPSAVCALVFMDGRRESGTRVMGLAQDKGSSLVGFTSDAEFLVFSRGTDDDYAVGAVVDESVSMTTAGMSVLDAVFGYDDDEPVNLLDDIHKVSGKVDLSAFLSAPSHVLPPMSLLLPKFMSEVLGEAPAATYGEDDDDMESVASTDTDTFEWEGGFTGLDDLPDSIAESESQSEAPLKPYNDVLTALLSGVKVKQTNNNNKKSKKKKKVAATDTEMSAAVTPSKSKKTKKSKKKEEDTPMSEATTPKKSKKATATGTSKKRKISGSEKKRSRRTKKSAGKGVN